MSTATPTKFHNLRITATKPMRTTKLALDGMELRGVVEYHLTQDVGGVTKLSLEMYIESINAETELLRKLLEDA